MKTMLAAVLLALCTSVHGEFFSGNHLLAECESRDASSRIDCLGYTSGAADAAQGRFYCPPDGVTRGQVRDVVIAHLRANAAQRHLTADVLVALALRDVWPCAPRATPGAGI